MKIKDIPLGSVVALKGKETGVKYIRIKEFRDRHGIMNFVARETSYETFFYSGEGFEWTIINEI